MQKFEAKRTELEVDLYGEVLKITKPTVGQIRGVYEKIDEMQKTQNPGLATDVWIEFFEALGFKRKTLEGMEPEHMSQLIDFVTGVKKK